MRAAVVILSLLALMPLPVTAQDIPSITVTGEGRVAVRPDMATIRLGVTTEARSAADALSANSADMARVLGFLGEAGIAEADIQTSGLRLNPRHEDYRNDSSAPRVIGFVATNEVTVRLRDLDRLGTVLDKVVGEGANRFDGLSFGLSDDAAALADARRRAVAEARTKAETYAGAAGVVLGPVRAITDQSGGVAPMDMRLSMAAMESVPVAPGEVTVQASVTITWALAD